MTTSTCTDTAVQCSVKLDRRTCITRASTCTDVQRPTKSYFALVRKSRRLELPHPWKPLAGRRQPWRMKHVLRTSTWNSRSQRATRLAKPIRWASSTSTSSSTGCRVYGIIACQSQQKVSRLAREPSRRPLRAIS
jgi:hypothetical protein